MNFSLYAQSMADPYSYYRDRYRYQYSYDYHKLTLELVGQYLATKGEDEPIGTIRDRRGCLLAMTLNYFYPDSTGMTYWIVGGVNYGQERFGGVPTSHPCPLIPELRHLVEIFDGISGHTITKAEFRAHLHAMGHTDYLISLFSPQRAEHSRMEEKEAYYRAQYRAEMLRQSWYNSPYPTYTHTSTPSAIDWDTVLKAESLTIPTLPEPQQQLTSIASALEGIDLGWMETKETKKQEVVVEDKELVLV